MWRSKRRRRVHTKKPRDFQIVGFKFISIANEKLPDAKIRYENIFNYFFISFNFDIIFTVVPQQLNLSAAVKIF